MLVSPYPVLLVVVFFTLFVVRYSPSNVGNMGRQRRRREMLTLLLLVSFIIIRPLFVAGQSNANLSLSRRAKQYKSISHRVNTSQYLTESATT